jgi:AhpD family alkylhydroperoxidase
MSVLKKSKRSSVAAAKKRSASLPAADPASSARGRHVPFPEEDNGAAHKAPEQIGSYSMVDPRFREIYFEFYKETYRPSVLDRKTKELVAISASLAAKCQGCLEGHIKKALKFGATREEISETIAIAMGVNAAAIVDLTDIAAENLEIKLF